MFGGGERLLFILIVWIIYLFGAVGRKRRMLQYIRFLAVVERVCFLLLWQGENKSLLLSSNGIALLS